MNKRETLLIYIESHNQERYT
eukprot:SAG31_NODE_21789_length_540_cov_27.251701_1_plen_20_part_01